jgi:outer membrane lipoprotein-sorting protein
MLRHMSALLVAALVVLSVGFVSAQDVPTVDELVANNLKAKGGLEKWRTITSLRQTAKALSQGAQADMLIYGKRPNLTRQEISVQGQLLVNGFDGQTAWMINPQMGPLPTVVSGLQADMIKDQSDFDGSLVDYKAKGSTIDFVATETLDGVRTYHLKLTKKNGAIEQIYLAAATFLEVKVASDASMGGVGMRIETSFSNYKSVDGVMLPFSVKTFTNGTLAVEMTVMTIEFNVKLDDAFFRMPVK